MIRKITVFSLLATAVLGLVPLACQPGGVGDPCVPEDEYHPTFPGYNAGEVNLEARSFQCDTRLCLVDHFQGRVSCKYGQAMGTDGNCTIPGDPTQPVTVKVDPQLKARTADRAVYCSCRCAGADSNARYCKCPSGFSCQHDYDDVGLGKGELAGSYCIRNGDSYADYQRAPDQGVACTPVGYPKVAPDPNPAKGEPTCGTDTGNH